MFYYIIIIFVLIDDFHRLSMFIGARGVPIP